MWDTWETNLWTCLWGYYLNCPHWGGKTCSSCGVLHPMAWSPGLKKHKQAECQYSSFRHQKQLPHVPVSRLPITTDPPIVEKINPSLLKLLLSVISTQQWEKKCNQDNSNMMRWKIIIYKALLCSYHVMMQSSQFNFGADALPDQTLDKCFWDLLASAHQPWQYRCSKQMILGHPNLLHSKNWTNTNVFLKAQSTSSGLAQHITVPPSEKWRVLGEYGVY